LCGLSGRGNYSLASSAGSYDILNRTRIMGTGSQIDIGPYALSDIQEKYTAGYYYNNAPGFYFTNVGEKIIDIYASTGNLSVSAWMKDQPGDDMSVTLSGNGVYSTFSTDSSGNWQVASLTASIIGSDKVLSLKFSNNATSTTGLVSDIRVY